MLEKLQLFVFTSIGTSSQVSDGAAAALLMTRKEAMRRGYPILGILRSCAVKGCPPAIMGIGPAVAIPLALEKAGDSNWSKRLKWVGAVGGDSSLNSNGA